MIVTPGEGRSRRKESLADEGKRLYAPLPCNPEVCVPGQGNRQLVHAAAFAARVDDQAGHDLPRRIRLAAECPQAASVVPGDGRFALDLDSGTALFDLPLRRLTALPW